MDRKFGLPALAGVAAGIVMSLPIDGAWAEATAPEWSQARASEFALWSKTHRSTSGAVRRLKTRTAAMVASAKTGEAEAAPVVWRTQDGIMELWDAAYAPKLVVLPAGEYTIGSPTDEPGRLANENPRHRVRIGYPLAVGRFDVTRAEFAAFVAASGYKPGASCFVAAGAQFVEKAEADWTSPGFTQSDNDPVVCVSWDDAQAYAQWLSQKTGNTYRLLSEAEWEYAARAGGTSAYPWGAAVGTSMASCDGCGSAWDNKQPSPVGSFAPNAFGLYDMSGNVWQWTRDCYKTTYGSAVVNGSAVEGEPCPTRSFRGGGYYTKPALVRSAQRFGLDPKTRGAYRGFRIAREL